MTILKYKQNIQANEYQKTQCIYVYIEYIRAVKRIIVSKIKVCVYIIYVGALCIIILYYKYTHMHVYLRICFY